ncbi:8e9907bd-18a3-46cf-b78b-239872a1a82e [Sclerotinia trifoliorum]|uniref:8e9907bd-18a3-46cf-b78b-239872a1a82e n=1 Tax=Sclerotinia trifoliorum TaxID=28548 RepID=A0A8H2VM55_9HELO|nr:8e9907bd-18a3-46cf-b78b-239872a1a82e [Sclerotinia trifoliorum]
MPLTIADIVFNEQANHNFSKTLGEIKRATLSIHNRLRSILEDAEFAESVANAYDRPLVANERCGSWYIDPNKKGGSAYFKSTDGHTGVWKFSSRRLNLHLLEIIGDNDGCIIVDSTRRGKRMPDALSKTIPIWCCVLNRVFFPSNPTAHKLYAPPQVVSDSEHAQMTNLLPQFVQAFQALNLPIETFRGKLRKPIRPIWVTPESQLSNTDDIFEDFHPVICCTVSRRVAGGEVSEGGYIQGAGDDTENWAHGLTPNIFWTNQHQLFETSEEDLPELIETLIDQSSSSLGSNTKLRLVKPTSCLSISTLDGVSSLENITGTCTIILLPKVTPRDTWHTSPTRMDIGLGSKKVGSKNLRAALKDITSFIMQTLQNLTDSPSHEPSTPHSQITIACESGQDLSIGVALALLCLYFNDNGALELRSEEDLSTVNKDFIRRRLSWISTSMPDANPSRATLQSVNSFLMSS